MDLAVPRLSRKAIDPDDYVCEPLSPVISIFIDEFNEFIVEEPARFDLFFNVLWADLIPTYESFFLLTDDTPRSSATTASTPACSGGLTGMPSGSGTSHRARSRWSP
jgi:hypothetical protein